MKQSCCFVFLCLLGLVASSQNPLVKQWDKRFGGIYDDQLADFKQTADGGFILAGTTASPIGADKTQPFWGTPLNSYDYWIVKIDSVGNKQWDADFGGTLDEKLYAVQQTKDGGYIAGGYSFSGISGNKTQENWDTTHFSGDYWVVKMDALGHKQWDRRYGGNNIDGLWSLQQTTDGGFILGGESASPVSGNKTQPDWDTVGLSEDMWIIKIDSVGNKQWDKRFGGSDDEDLFCVRQTKDGGYLLGGASYSGISGDKTQPNWGPGLPDYWIVKTDSAGNKLWDKRYGGPLGDVLYSFEQTPDGGYILGGMSQSDSGDDKSQPNWDHTLATSDYWIIKIDSVGNKQWDKRFGGTDWEFDFGNISITSDGNYLFAGDSYSHISGDKSENDLGYIQTWVVKIDRQGNKIWDKTILSHGGDQCGWAIQTREGCYAVANWTYADTGGYKTQLSRGRTDFWILKFCDTSRQCTVNPPHVFADNNRICPNDSAHICAPVGFTSYLWSNGDTTRCFKTSQAGNYYVTVYDQNNCSAESNHLAISVYPSPPVTISIKGDTMSCYNASACQWYHNGQSISGATSHILIVKAPGSYTVEVTDSNGCITTSSPFNYTGIENIEDDYAVVYPNPSMSAWQLQVTDKLIGAELQIFDTKGSLVYQSIIQNQHSEIAFTAAQGIYVMRINMAGMTLVRKMVRL